MQGDYCLTRSFNMTLSKNISPEVMQNSNGYSALSPSVVTKTEILDHLQEIDMSYLILMSN